MKLNVAMAQINTVLGDVERNLEKHLELVAQARRGGADLITFPELSLTGYVLQDLAPTVSCRPLPMDPVFNKLIDASQGIDIVVGFVEEDVRNRFFIASAYLSRGEILHVHRKVYLPTYGLFDEGRFFALGESGPGLRHPLWRGWACSSARISGTPRRPICSGSTARTCSCLCPLPRGAA